MESKTIIEKIISSERLQPYLTHHNNNQEKAIQLDIPEHTDQPLGSKNQCEK